VRQRYEDQLAATGCGVNCFSEALEPDAVLLQVCHRINQVPKGPSQPVKPPDNKGVPLTQMGECVLKPRPAGFSATDMIGEDSLAARLLEGIPLGIKVLLLS
jgi:hypothetical protein